MDTQQFIGKIHTQDLPRDAIHIAVASVIADEELVAGYHIGLKTDGRVANAVDGIKGIGIVDPFLIDAVKKGERFFIFLYPGSVIDLTHHYIHPVLDANLPEIKARNVIYNWIDTWFFNYGKDDEMTRDTIYKKMLSQFINKEEFDFDGRWRNEDLSEDNNDQFLTPIYDALEIISGKKATKEQREHYYSCCV